MNALSEQEPPSPKGGLTAWFGVDLRSLAALRIALGLLIAGDLLFLRWPSLIAHYAGGIFSPSTLMTAAANVGWHSSLHWFSTSPWWQGTLFLLQSLAALALIVGWRTWLIAPLNWLLLGSVQTANVYLIDGGDALLRQLLLFACFLSLGARWSLDAKRSQGIPRKHLPLCYTPAAACLIIQLACVYWFSLFYKAEPMWTQSFDALYYAFHNPLYAKGLAQTLANYPFLLKGMTLFAYGWEALGPLIVIAAWRRPRLRIAAIIMFWLFHGMIFLTFGIELFSLTCMAGWIILLPGLFWDKLGLASARSPEPLPRPARRILIYSTQCLAVALLLLVLAGNALGVMGKPLRSLPAPLYRLSTAFMLNQRWNPFSSEVNLSRQAWIAIDGQTANRQWVNLITGEAANSALPSDGRVLFPNERWRRSTLLLANRKKVAQLDELTRYYAAQWNTHAAPAQQISRVRLTIYYDQIEPPGTAPEVKVVRHLVFQKNL